MPSISRFKYLLKLMVLSLFFTFASACSSDSATGSALPQPSVDCNGSSCID